jgi:hypothetical protein
MKIVMTAKPTNPFTRPTALYFQNLLISSRGEPYLRAPRKKLRSEKNKSYRPVSQTAGRAPAHDHHRVVWITDRVIAVYTTSAVSSTGIRGKAMGREIKGIEIGFSRDLSRYVLGKS